MTHHTGARRSHIQPYNGVKSGVIRLTVDSNLRQSKECIQELSHMTCGGIPIKNSRDNTHIIHLSKTVNAESRLKQDDSSVML